MDVVLIYDRLIKLTVVERAKMSRPEQILFWIVTVRCAKDMGGFCSVFEQTLDEKQINIVIEGLQVISEKDLADAFGRCRKILTEEKFYEHYDCRKVPEAVWQTIDKIGDDIGDRLWDLDEKLEALVDGKPNSMET